MYVCSYVNGLHLYCSFIQSTSQLKFTRVCDVLGKLLAGVLLQSVVWKLQAMYQPVLNRQWSGGRSNAEDPGRTRCRVSHPLDEQFSRKLLAATPEATQFRRSPTGNCLFHSELFVHRSSINSCHLHLCVYSFICILLKNAVFPTNYDEAFLYAALFNFINLNGTIYLFSHAHTQHKYTQEGKITITDVNKHG